jgi:hypothetical protein
MSTLTNINARNVCGVAHFGFLVVWVNQFAPATEVLPGQHEYEIFNLSKSPHLFDF